MPPELVLAPGGNDAPGGGPLLSSPQWSRSKSMPPHAGLSSSAKKVNIFLILNTKIQKKNNTNFFFRDITKLNESVKIHKLTYMV